MKSGDDMTTRILASLNALPAQDQADVILMLMSAAMKTMTVYRILQIRGEIEAELSPTVPLVVAALDLIDGQIALREIAGDETWR